MSDFMPQNIYFLNVVVYRLSSQDWANENKTSNTNGANSKVTQIV